MNDISFVKALVCVKAGAAGRSSGPRASASAALKGAPGLGGDPDDALPDAGRSIETSGGRLSRYAAAVLAGSRELHEPRFEPRLEARHGAR